MANTGINYTYANASLTNKGAGTGAVFDFQTAASGIVDINVVHAGRHYSYANIIVDSLTGSGASFTTSLTPVPQYNGYVDANTGYDLNNIAAGKYTSTYFVATSSVDGVVKIPSSYVFDTQYEAFQYINTEVEELKAVGLPFDNYVFVGASVLDSDGKVLTVSIIRFLGKSLQMRQIIW
jgi:hypothetical protein